MALWLSILAEGIYAEKYVLVTKTSNLESECGEMCTRDRLRFVEEL